jgi:glycerol uptake facilitator-like aquaporin
VQDKPGNIAGAAIVASFFVLVVILIVSAKDPNFKTDALIPVFTGIITLALGYLFGKGSGH